MNDEVELLRMFICVFVFIGALNSYKITTVLNKEQKTIMYDKPLPVKAMLILLPVPGWIYTARCARKLNVAKSSADTLITITVVTIMTTLFLLLLTLLG